MTQLSPIRWFTLLAPLLCAAIGTSAFAQPPRPQQKRNAPAPIVRRAPEPQPQQQNRPQPQQQNRPQPQPQQPPTSSIIGIQRHEAPNQRVQNGEHLAGWLDHHSNLTPAQQQEALEREPGFHDLPPQTQQRYRDRLTQLNNMPPEARSRMIDRTEAMEKLTPEQRGQVRSAMQPLAAMQPDRRRIVSRTFRALRNMPPAQRQAYMNSPEYRSQFSDQERGTLNGLMAAEPYIPRAEQ